MAKHGNSTSDRGGYSPGSGKGHRQAVQPTQVSNVIVKASAVEAARTATEPYELVQAVIDFVNYCINEFHYTRDEIPQPTMQVYHADFYLAQVNNGGHSQFIGKAAEATFRDAQVGLTAMGAPHARIFMDMLSWITANPQESTSQNGFESRSPFLDTLDDQLYDLEKSSSMINFSVQWILSWPELQVVPDDSYLDEMLNVKMANGKYMDRHLLKIVRGLEFESTEELRVAIGLALTSLPKPETLVRVGGGSYMEIEGRQQMAFRIETNKGKREIVLGDTDVRLFEYLEGDSAKLEKHYSPINFEKILKITSSSKYKKPKVGRRLATVSQQSVAEVIEVSKANLSGAAIGLLLGRSRQIFPPPTIAAFPVQMKSDQTKALTWLVSTEKDQLVVETAKEHSIARKLSDLSIVAECSRPVVQAFLAKLEADAGLEGHKAPDSPITGFKSILRTLRRVVRGES